MRDDEKRAFKALMESTAAYYDRKLVAETIGIYWRGLSDLTIDQVRAALNAHAQDPQAGQYMPKIADIRRQIEANRNDGHPGPDEAWSIALGARHEGATVIWTEQIARAFFEVAMPLLDEGDKIAARKAFLERYERELTKARREGIAARWQASLGADQRQRIEAIEQAQRQGRISADHARSLLPAPEIDDRAVLRIENASDAAGVNVRDQLAALRRLVRLP